MLYQILADFNFNKYIESIVFFAIYSIAESNDNINLDLVLQSDSYNRMRMMEWADPPHEYMGLELYE